MKLKIIFCTLVATCLHVAADNPSQDSLPHKTLTSIKKQWESAVGTITGAAIAGVGGGLFTYYQRGHNRLSPDGFIKSIVHDLAWNIKPSEKERMTAFITKCIEDPNFGPNKNNLDLNINRSPLFCMWPSADNDFKEKYVEYIEKLRLYKDPYFPNRKRIALAIGATGLAIAALSVAYGIYKLVFEEEKETRTENQK